MNMIRGWMTDLQVLLGMVVVQLTTTGLQILSRVILVQGTFIFALTTYRLAVAAITIAPFAIYFERGAVKKLTLRGFFWVFSVASGISMGMGLFYYGLHDTSATYASNFFNLIPVVTFIFSTIFRIEKVGIRTVAGKVKFVGAMLCLAGALTVALYTGHSFHLGRYYKNVGPSISTVNHHMTRGTIILVGSCLSYGAWFILQVKLYETFPYKYWSTLLVCTVGAIQSGLISLCVKRDLSSWRLRWNLQLLTILYSGILSTAATFALISWAIAQKGPTYPSMFNPLSLILILIIESLFLGEKIAVGSLIGMVLIIAGVYAYLWGKNRAEKGGGNGGADLEEARPKATTTNTPEGI